MKRILSILSVAVMLVTMCAAITLPAVAETAPFTSIYTIYDAGLWKADGSDVGTASKTTYKSANKITVAEGDKIYFGPCRTNQGYQLYHWDAEGTTTTVKNSSAELAIAGIFDSGDVLYCYTAPKAGEIGLVCYHPYFNTFVITKNEEVTVDNFFEYWAKQNPLVDLSQVTTAPALSTNAFKAVEPQGYYTSTGTINTSSAHYSGELIEVKAGDIVYFGPVNLDQNFQLFDWHGSDATDFSNSTKITESIVQAGTRVHTVGRFPGGQGILAYEVTTTGRVGLVNATAYNKIFFATKNVRMTTDNLYEYWDLHSNTITDYSSIVGRYDNVTPKESVLNGKTALFTGDSICAAAADDDYFNDLGLGGWSGRIAMNYGLEKAVNNGVSGAALSNTRDRWYNAASGSTSKQQGRIYWQVASESAHLYDYVILHGGTNDAWDDAPIGTISDSFEFEDFDLTTYAGGLEATIYQAVKYHPEAAIGYVMNFAMPLKNSGSIPSLDKYFAVGKQICEKWNIPYLDLHTTLNAETFDTNIYTRDFVHPNAAGYNIIAPLIGDWMETLEPYSEVTKNTDKTVIACVGDSLTKGEESGDIIRNSYPAYLQAMLGEENYEVYNFGWGGAAAQTTASTVYKNTRPYKKSMMGTPDQVIIMLGTNDARSNNGNWNTADPAASLAKYKADLKALVEGYMNLPSNPTVYLATPPYINRSAYLTIYNDGGLLAAVREIADELEIKFIDTFNPTSEHPELICDDNAHYTAEGYKLIASIMYEGITGETAPTLTPVTEKDTAVEETNPAKPLIRNWKAYYETVDAFRIETVEDVELFGDLISAGITFEGKTVYLENDLDFTGIRFKPLGASSGSAENQNYDYCFKGTFDGQKHVFSNVYITDYMYSAIGLFPALYGATIKDFGLDGGLIEGYSVVGGITAYGDYGTVIENVWSSADVFAVSSPAGIAGNMRQNGAPEPPKMVNVACYGMISGKDVVSGISAWGQTSSLRTENIVFGGTLDLHAKTNNCTPFVRYGSTGLTGLATGYFTTQEAEMKTVYVSDVEAVRFSRKDFTDSTFAYYMNNLEGNDTKWIMKHGYAVPWGDEDTAIVKIKVDGKDAYSNENSGLPADLLAKGSYWYGTDGRVYSSEIAKDWILNEGDAIRFGVSAASADIAGNGSLDTADVVLLLKYVDRISVEGMTDTIADVNADGKVTLFDAIKLMQVLNDMHG